MVFLKVACCVEVLVIGSLSRMCCVPLDSSWPLPKGQRLLLTKQWGCGDVAARNNLVASRTVWNVMRWLPESLLPKGSPREERAFCRLGGSIISKNPHAWPRHTPFSPGDHRMWFIYHPGPGGCVGVWGRRKVVQSHMHLFFFQNIKVVEKILKDQKVGMLQLTLSSNI